MIFRRCDVSDIEAIYKIEEEAFSDPLKKETFLKDLERESFYCYGAFTDELVAFISYEKVFDEGQIISVATSKNHRRKGYAKKLFETVTLNGKKDGIEFFTLEVRSDNEAAIGLYELLGFKMVGVRKNYYQSPVCDAVLMDLYIGKE